METRRSIETSRFHLVANRNSQSRQRLCKAAVAVGVAVTPTWPPTRTGPLGELNSVPPTVVVLPTARPLKPPVTPVNAVFEPVSTAIEFTWLPVNSPLRPLNVKLWLEALSALIDPLNCEGTRVTLSVVRVPGAVPVPAVKPVESSNTD